MAFDIYTCNTVLLVTPAQGIFSLSASAAAYAFRMSCASQIAAVALSVFAFVAAVSLITDLINSHFDTQCYLYEYFFPYRAKDVDHSGGYDIEEAREVVYALGLKLAVYSVALYALGIVALPVAQFGGLAALSTPVVDVLSLKLHEMLLDWIGE